MLRTNLLSKRLVSVDCLHFEACGVSVLRSLGGVPSHCRWITYIMYHCEHASTGANTHFQAISLLYLAEHLLYSMTIKKL